MSLVQKTLPITIADRRKDGGRIVISTGSVDRDRDRVFPQGAKLENYLKNPVVLWGHNYGEPWSTIGRTRSLEVTETGIVADFELREPASDTDPQHIVRYLWENEFVRSASIGFRPETAVPNDMGGMDFPSWELLEWSIVPIPANQDALRLAATSHPKAYAAYQKAGRVLSAKNEGRIRSAYDALGEVLGELESDGKRGKDAASTGALRPSARAWVRMLDVQSDAGDQTVFACFQSYQVRVPDDAVQLDCDDDGVLVETPHPDRGQVITRKSVDFIPPIEASDDATYSLHRSDLPDEEMVKDRDNAWEVVGLSDVLLSLSGAGPKMARHDVAIRLKRLTRKGVRLATTTLRKQARSVGGGITTAPLMEALRGLKTVLEDNER